MARVSVSDCGCLVFESSVIVASFQVSGKMPVNMEELMILTTEGNKAGKASLSMLEEILSLPIPSESLSSRSLLTIASSTAVKSNTCVDDVSSGDRMILSMAPSSSGFLACEMDAKCSFRV